MPNTSQIAFRTLSLAFQGWPKHIVLGPRSSFIYIYIYTDKTTLRVIRRLRERGLWFLAVETICSDQQFKSSVEIACCDRLLKVETNILDQPTSQPAHQPPATQPSSQPANQPANPPSSPASHIGEGSVSITTNGVFKGGTLTLCGGVKSMHFYRSFLTSFYDSKNALNRHKKGQKSTFVESDRLRR